MKNKKNLKSKKLAILPVFAMLLTGIVSITGVTYAWFSSGDNAVVSDIDLKVKTADGVLASWTGEDGSWKSELSLTENTGTGSAFKVIPSKSADADGKGVSEVSTTNTVVDGVPTFYTATLDADGDTLTTVAQNNARENADVDYIMFDIYFKVDKPTYLFLGNKSSVESYDGANKDDQPTDTEKAARVGFINQGSSLTNKDASGGYTVLPALMNGEKMVIWEPHATEHISASGLPTDATGTKVDYLGVSKAGTFKISEEKGKNDTTADSSEYLKSVTTYTEDNLKVPSTNPDVEGAEPLTDGQYLVHLNEGYNKVTVCIWLEGQDADCLNEISGSTLHSAIEFIRYAAAE